MSIECAFFGVLGRDGELKTSKAGKQYLKLNVRVGDGDGAQWVGVMVFGDEAVEIAPKLLKGSRVYIEGSIKLDLVDSTGWQQTAWLKRDVVALPARRHRPQQATTSWSCKQKDKCRNSGNYGTC
jgi:single-stranded DNA-binding protein